MGVQANGSDAINLRQGTYDVRVTDANGCQRDFQVFVDQYSRMIFSSSFLYVMYWSNILYSTTIH